MEEVEWNSSSSCSGPFTTESCSQSAGGWGEEEQEVGDRSMMSPTTPIRRESPSSKLAPRASTNRASCCGDTVSRATCGGMLTRKYIGT